MHLRFTERARRVVFFAKEEAEHLAQNYVSTEHLLLALVRENDGAAARILDRMGVSLARIRSEIERQVTRGDGRLGQDMQLTPRAKRVIDLAYDEARQLSNNYIGTEHLLLGLIREGEELAGRVFAKLGVKLGLIREGEELAGRVLAKLGVNLDKTRREVLAMKDGDASASPKSPHQNPAPADRFAAEFEQLDGGLAAALTGDGLPLNQAPEELRRCLQQMFEHHVQNGAFILDPNASMRVNPTQLPGAVHYTVTAKASFLVNFVQKDASPHPPAPAPEPPQEPETDQKDQN